VGDGIHGQVGGSVWTDDVFVCVHLSVRLAENGVSIAIGAIATCFNSHWKTHELEQAINHTTPRAIFLDLERWNHFQQCKLSAACVPGPFPF
jgi:hypothetical protein